MSEQMNDGGPAFPTKFSNFTDQDMVAWGGMAVPANSTGEYMGMSLRDYFAAKAMQALLAAATTAEVAELVPGAAYNIADGMLAARAKGEQQ